VTGIGAGDQIALCRVPAGSASHAEGDWRPLDEAALGAVAAASADEGRAGMSSGGATVTAAAADADGAAAEHEEGGRWRRDDAAVAVVVFDRRWCAAGLTAGAGPPVPPLEPSHLPLPPPPGAVDWIEVPHPGEGGELAQLAEAETVFGVVSAVSGVAAGGATMTAHDPRGMTAALRSAIVAAQGLRRLAVAWARTAESLAEGGEERAHSIRAAAGQVRLQAEALAAAAGQTAARCRQLEADARECVSWLRAAVLPAANAASADVDAWLDNCRATALWSPHADMVRGSAAGRPGGEPPSSSPAGGARSHANLLLALPLAQVRELADAHLPVAVAAANSAAATLSAKGAAVATVASSVAAAGGVAAAMSHREGRPPPSSTGGGASATSPVGVLQQCLLAITAAATEAAALAAAQRRDVASGPTAVEARCTDLIAQLLAGSVPPTAAGPRLAALAAAVGTSASAPPSPDSDRPLASVALSDVLAAMAARDAALQQLQARVHEVLTRAAATVVAFMRQVIVPAQTMAGSVGDGVATAHTAGRQVQVCVGELAVLERLPAAYGALLHECARRHAAHTKLQQVNGTGGGGLSATTARLTPVGWQPHAGWG
jgi:hypothetical protein